MATKQPHPHAALMLQYAKDCAENIDAHEQWEFMKSQSDSWKTCAGAPAWSLSYNYRRKPRLITIGDIQIPAPETTPPEKGKDYFVPYFHALDDSKLASPTEWQGDRYDLNMLKRGLVHLSEEAALAHAKALIALTALKDE